MINTVFSDEIINPTELKKNQRYWLDKAQRQPVTVKFGDNGLAIVDRELMKNLYAEKKYAELLVKLCEEMKSSLVNITVLPWANSLPGEEKEKFIKDFLKNFFKAVQNNTWSEIEELLDDWKATAEAWENPEFVEAWGNREKLEDYYPLDARKD